MEADLLDLLRVELRKRMAEAMGPGWQARVLKLSERLPREYQMVQAFSRCLALSLEEIAAFPERFEKWSRERVILWPVSEPVEEDQPVMTLEQHDQILEEKAARGNRFVLDVLKTRKPAAREAAGVST